jgi:hypothetical protein
MATIEDIYSTLVREGVNRNLHVVPEFCVRSREHLFKKKIDVAWLRPRDDPSRFGSLRRWQIVAAFEIEGHDVPLERLHRHSAQFRQLWLEEGNRFPCYVPLYTRAHHRADPEWGEAAPEQNIQQRIAEAETLGGVVRVIDGRRADWLQELPQ